MLVPASILLVLVISVALLAVGLGALDQEQSREVGAREVKAEGLRWVGLGTAGTPRRDGDEWEVDVKRPDGSIVEVTLGEDLQLKAFDQELGPGGRLAADELTGAARRRAIAAAVATVGPGRVFSVERESENSIEVNLRRRDGAVEVQLDSGHQVIEVAPEDPGDE